MHDMAMIEMSDMFFTICSKITLTDINSFYNSFFVVFSVSCAHMSCVWRTKMLEIPSKNHIFYEKTGIYPKEVPFPAMFAIFANITYFPFGWTVWKSDTLFPSRSIKKIRGTHLNVSVQFMVQKNAQQLWILAFKYYNNSTWTETSVTYVLLMLQQFYAISFLPTS